MIYLLFLQCDYRNRVDLELLEYLKRRLKYSVLKQNKIVIQTGGGGKERSHSLLGQKTTHCIFLHIHSKVSTSTPKSSEFLLLCLYKYIFHKPSFYFHKFNVLFFSMSIDLVRFLIEIPQLFIQGLHMTLPTSYIFLQDS